MIQFLVIMAAWIICLAVALYLYRRHRRRHPKPLDPHKMAARDWLHATHHQPVTPPHGTPQIDD